MAKLTLFGLAGTGTSTVGRALAKNLSFQFISNGDFTRAQAKELGLSLNEFDELCKTDNKYDLDRDAMVVEYGRTHDNFLAEGRLPWHFIPDSLKIKLDCDFDTRIKRVAQREHITFEQAKQNTIAREEAIRIRFLNSYNIADCADNAHFNLIVDTTHVSAVEVIAKIEKYVRGM